MGSFFTPIVKTIGTTIATNLASKAFMPKQKTPQMRWRFDRPFQIYGGRPLGYNPRQPVTSLTARYGTYRLNGYPVAGGGYSPTSPPSYEPPTPPSYEFPEGVMRYENGKWVWKEDEAFKKLRKEREQIIKQFQAQLKELNKGAPPRLKEFRKKYFNELVKMVEPKLTQVLARRGVLGRELGYATEKMIKEAGEKADLVKEDLLQRKRNAVLQAMSAVQSGLNSQLAQEAYRQNLAASMAKQQSYLDTLRERNWMDYQLGLEGYGLKRDMWDYQRDIANRDYAFRTATDATTLFGLLKDSFFKKPEPVITPIIPTGYTPPAIPAPLGTYPVTPTHYTPPAIPAPTGYIMPPKGTIYTPPLAAQ